MEHLAPPYQFTLDLLYELESGGTARSAVKKYTTQFQNEFCIILRHWLRLQEFGELVIAEPTFKSSYQKAIWDLLMLSQQGVSLVIPVRELELELRFVCEEQLEQHLATLPYKLMIPLLFMQFPSLMVILLGPLLAQLLTEVAR
jgi:hypothetical protein